MKISKYKMHGASFFICVISCLCAYPEYRAIIGIVCFSGFSVDRTNAYFKFDQDYWSTQGTIVVGNPNRPKHYLFDYIVWSVACLIIALSV